jgi:ACR3 family arsenite efflux pump ArsB
MPWYASADIPKFLGIPLALGIITRFSLLFLIGKHHFHQNFLPYFSPFALAGLLYTIIIIFAQQAEHILHNLGPVFRTIVPLLLYFMVMFTGTFGGMWWWSRRKGEGKGWGYEEAAVQSFTAASNNFVSHTSASLCGGRMLMPRAGVIYSCMRGGLWRGFGSSLSVDHRTVGGSPCFVGLDLGGDIPRKASEMGFSTR